MMQQILFSNWRFEHSREVNRWRVR